MSPARARRESDAAVAHVCVIDDDQAIRESLRALLEDAGHDVIEAAKAATGIGLLRASGKRHVVLVDYRMPDIDGSALLELVMADAALASRHAFICITASPDRLPTRMLHLLERLGAPVMAKPFDIGELLDVIAQSVQRLTQVQVESSRQASAPYR